MKRIKPLSLLVIIGSIVIFSQRYIIDALNYISNSRYGFEFEVFFVFILGISVIRVVYVFLQDESNASAVIKGAETISRFLPFRVLFPEQTGINNTSIPEFIDKKLREQEERLNNYINNKVFPENINNSFSDLYKEKLEQLATDDIIALAEANYSNNSIKKYFQARVDSDITLSSNRLESQISRTNRSASINLIVGALTTGAAVYLLFTTLQETKVHEIRSFQDFLGYIPRLTLSIFIEIFSFFFLRLYRKNLEDIKYLYNEWTNIELKSLAYKTAVYKDSDELIKTVVEELVKTERNFVLKTGETTVDAERLKIEIEDRNKLVEAISSVFKKQSSDK